MRKLNQKRNERGALIIEIIAVVALLGVMGPMLFKQVKNRNEEVDNINIASEVRTVKEAFSAYIMSERSTLLARCQDEGTEMEINSDELLEYLPIGNNSAELYDLILNCEDGLLQGLIVPQELAVPENLGLKRAARIANLIGADGGICQNGTINGVAGGWETNGDGICPVTGQLYVATTGMDTFTPEVTYEDYSASMVSLPNRLVMENFHAWKYFSVGGDSKCYTIKHNQTGDYSAEHGFTANDDIIENANKGGCEPVFWVGSTEGTTDANVYVKSALKIGSVGDKKAVSLFSGASHTDPLDIASNNKIEVYDSTGTSRIIINGKGEIIAQDTAGKERIKINGATGELIAKDADGKERIKIDAEKSEITIGDTTDGTAKTLTLTNQMLKSSENALKSGENYKIDLTDVSVMKDIKIESRGGGHLSDLLPKFISKEIYSLDTSGAGTSNPCVSGTCYVPVPKCPKQHAPAVIVIPTYWEKQTLKSSDIAKNLKADIVNGTISSINANKEHITDGGLYMYIQGKNKAGSINHASLPGPVIGESNFIEGDEWEITFSTKAEENNSIVDVSRNVKAIAQTYCVYDEKATF